MTAADVAAMDADDCVLALLEIPQPDDPYPIYHRLREIAPSHPSIIGMRFLSRYDDVWELLRSPLFHMAVAETMAKSDTRYPTSAWLQTVETMLIFANPPRHTRIRGVLSRAFTPRRTEALRPRIQELVDAHLDRCAEKGTFDLIEELAGVLPCQVICALLGVPMEEVAQIERWTADIAATVTPVLDDDVLAAADRTIVEFHSYLRKLVAERRNAPQDDLLTAMVHAEDNEGRLDDDELVSFAVTLLGAGTETTTNLIGVGTLALLQTPDELRKLRQDPALVAGAVEELLRFEPPVQMGFVRVALEDTVIGGEEIIGNELVIGLIGAANHDPAAFPDPAELRVDRPFDKRPHLAFGQGVHYCMGAALGRLEGEIALRSLLIDRFPNLTVVDDHLTWRNAFTLRGVERLTVSIG